MKSVIQPCIGVFIISLVTIGVFGQAINTPTVNGIPHYKTAPYCIDDFYINQVLLSAKVDSIYATLSDTQRVAQMIISSIGKAGQPWEKVRKLAAKGYIGGINVMGDTKEHHQQQINQLNELTKSNQHPALLYSMDAEPSLMRNRMPYLAPLPKTSDINDSIGCVDAAQKISNALLELGITLNYAPVADLSNTNAAITHRSFGNDIDSVVTLCKYFINASESMGVLTTVKHFPGHGLVTGDTHHRTVFIDGELKELPVFEALINSKTHAIMVAHLTIKNNEAYQTSGLPATCSPVIIQQLLKDELQFKGLIITDALGMAASAKIKDMGLKASKAGCDILLMPDDEFGLLCQILTAMNADSLYQQQVMESVKKIIRMKICLGIL